MNKFNTVLFDMDGTVANSKPGILRSIKLAFDKKGLKYTQSVLDKMIGPPFRLSMKMFFGLEGEPVEDFIEIYRKEYEARGYLESVLYDGVTDMLKSLKSGGIRVAMATSKPIKFTNMMIDAFKIREYFDFIGGATSDSAGETKADVIKLCFNALDITQKDKENVLMVGDRLYDVEGAHQCGIKCAGALWGYGDIDEFKEYKADFILDKPGDVVNLVLNK